MQSIGFLILGFFGSLLVMPAVADDSGKTALHSTVGVDGPAAGQQTQRDAGAMSDGEKVGAAEATTATKGKGKTKGKTKDAGTATLFRYIYDQDKKGNIKIEGSTDTAPPP